MAMAQMSALDLSLSECEGD